MRCERMLRKRTGGLGGVLVRAVAIGALCCGEDTKALESRARKLIGQRQSSIMTTKCVKLRARLSINNETLKKLALVLHMALGTSFVPES